MALIAPRVSNSTLYPIAVLIDELRHEDVQIRLNSVQQLEHVAIALGPSRTRSELIPFLIECADENDVVLAATAEKLGHMVDAVGGGEFASFLLGPLEDLLVLDELSVRENALNSISTIISRMPTRQVEDVCLKMIVRLASNDWFMSRICACTLMSQVAHRAFTDALLTVFIDLCSDDTPMVRRAAISVIPAVAKETPANKQRDLLDALRRLARDDQESVRILTISTAMSLATDVFPDPQDSFNALFPEIRSCVDDSSWRVRVSVCEHMDQILQHTPTKNHQQVLDLYNRLLTDVETEVRLAAVSKLPSVAVFKPDRSFINLITPSLNKLVKDEVETVRTGLAESLTKSSQIFGPSLTVDSIFHFLLKSLRDSSPLVRLGVISNLSNISTLLKLDEMAPCLIPAISELASDRQWRIRLRLLENTATLAKSLGPVIFVKDVLPIVLRWLCDPVFKVREAAASQLGGLANELGPHMTETHLIPQVIEMAKNSNYLYRMTAIMAIVSLTIQNNKNLLFVLKSLSTDPVPNVRFNVAKALRTINRRSDHTHIESILKPMTKDSDPDVEFYAKQTLEFYLHHSK